MTPERRLAGWVAEDLAAHLDRLVELARQWRDGKAERPVVTLHLASGRSHTGYVLELVRSTLALQGLPQRGTMDLDVTAIPVARIEALTMHAAQDLVESAPLPAGATSMLDLKRRAKALGDLVTTRAQRPITVEVGAGELAELGPLLEMLKVALDRVCGDELGRGSLADRVQRVELRAGSPGVSLANAILVVSGPLTAERLQKELDAVL